MRVLRISTGCLWAGGLLLVGLWLWGQPLSFTDGDAMAAGYLEVILMVLLIAAGQFIFMVFVADVLCPDAPMVVTGLLKGIAGATGWIALVVSVWLLWRLWV